MRPTLPLLVLASMLCAGEFSLAADEKPSEKGTLDSYGRPDDRLLDQSRRFYVWHDSNGWHIRSASKQTNQFEGTIKIVDGTITRCRPVGIETTGGSPDAWRLNPERNKLEFAMSTQKSFDGFDFNVKGGSAIEFDLLIAGGKAPNRIFIGKKAQHPPSATFTLPIRSPKPKP